MTKCNHPRTKCPARAGKECMLIPGCKCPVVKKGKKKGNKDA